MSRAQLTRNGVSDPSLIWAVGDVRPVTEEEERLVRARIARSFPTDHPEDRLARHELGAILFGDTLEGA